MEMEGQFRINDIKNYHTMTSSWHGKVFYITGPFWRESDSDWWIPFTKGQSCKYLVFLIFFAGPDVLLNKQLSNQWFNTAILLMWCACDVDCITETTNNSALIITKIMVWYYFQFT